jgi:hypothetical protein
VRLLADNLAATWLPKLGELVNPQIEASSSQRIADPAFLVRRSKQQTELFLP